MQWPNEKGQKQTVVSKI